MQKIAGILVMLAVMANGGWTGGAAAQTPPASDATGEATDAPAGAAGPPLAGEFERFIVHDAPRPATLSTPFVARDGTPHRIDDFAGRYVLVNFWAASCEGSRYEVPTLDALQETIGADRLAVLLIASDDGGWVPIDLFRNALEIHNAEIFLDDELRVLAESGLTETRMGSILYDPDGMEVGRIDAWADWDTPEAVALIDYLVSR